MLSHYIEANDPVVIATWQLQPRISVGYRSNASTTSWLSYRLPTSGVRCASLVPWLRSSILLRFFKNSNYCERPLDTAEHARLDNGHRLIITSLPPNTIRCATLINVSLRTVRPLTFMAAGSLRDLTIVGGQMNLVCILSHSLRSLSLHQDSVRTTPDSSNVQQH